LTNEVITKIRKIREKLPSREKDLEERRKFETGSHGRDI